MSKLLTLPTGLALMAGLVFASTATAQTTATWVKDINTNPSTVTSPSSPYPYRTFTGQNANQWVMLGTQMIFRATTSTTGYELWGSDGTVAGTKMIKDIYPGSSSSSPGYFTLVGKKVYFSASDAKNGRELWVTDGTATGTVMVADIRPGTSSSSPYNLAMVGTKVVFAANDGSNKYGSELYVSDGTKAGTVLLMDIRPGASSSSINYCMSTFIGHRVFFYATDGKNGYEPWVTDGTAKGTFMVKDIYPGASSSSPRYFKQLGPTKVCFPASNGKTGYELWVSDGTATGTTLVLDIYPGTNSGTDFYSASSFGTKILFRGRTLASGYEAWVTDGTAKGTIQVADVRSGSASSYMYYSAGDAGMGYWGASSNAGKYEIWATDGTKAGTKRFCQADALIATPSYVTATGGKVYFQGRLSATTGYEICVADGKTATLVKDIRPGTGSGYAYYCSPIAKGVVAFAADDGIAGRELWVSKGTAATTILIDIHKATGPTPTANDDVRYIESLFGKIIFAATDGTDKSKKQSGLELYISDGTATGTKLLKDIYVGTSTTNASSSYPSYMCRLGNYVYFYATNGTNGYEVWRTDGTTAGTKLFADIRKGSLSSYPRYFKRIGDKIYFQANDGTNGTELWVLDGTATGTKMVKNIYAGASSSSPRHFERMGMTDKFLFYAYNTGTGYELYISNGTSAGTSLVKDIYAGTGSSYPSYMKGMNGKVYFEARTLAAGYELWESDGTSTGTKLVKDLYPGSSSGYARDIELQNKKIYFYAYSTTSGYEMHTSDGTATGTILYWNLNAGTASTYPRYMTAVGSRRIYFQGTYTSSTTSFGYEPIWFDVTTKSGEVWNMNPSGSSYPYNWQGSRGKFAVDNGSVYMAARPTNVYDNRLLKMGNGATAQAIGRAQDSSVMTATDPQIGKNMTIAGATGVKNPLTVLCLGVEAKTPTSLGTFVPDSYAYFQLTNYFWIIGNYPGKAWASVFGVPNDPTLLGDMAVLQGFSLNALAFPAQTEVTNGVHLTMGK